jgi:hypothetical protein
MNFWNKLYRVHLLRCTNIYRKQCNYMFIGDCRGRDRMVVICTTTYAICWPFVPFLLSIVFSVILLYTDSGYPSGVFKLVLQHNSVSNTPRHARNSSSLIA